MINEFISQLRKVGGSVVITIPKPVLEKYGLNEKTYVSCVISEADDKPLLYKLLKGEIKDEGTT
ncbi:AbrB/MazE/SpoVT family DNA-binding domain-containing protein [Candidatus Woesearchaeota archaeon]|nr:AbrB/MazE/SpoVT family DNA-binding domain-containing protein [Candidatus Woesearchaeota archaeon]